MMDHNRNTKRWGSVNVVSIVLLVPLLLTACESKKEPQPKDNRSPTRGATANIVEPPKPWPPRAATSTFLDRPADADLRLMNYNVLWNTIFEEESPEGAAKFARLVRALDPDILTLQEIGLPSWKRERNPNARDWNTADVVQRMNAIHPPPEGGTWYAHQAYDNVIVSKYPLKMTAVDTEPRGQRRQALALVDLPNDTFAIDFYLMNNHYKCCGGEDNDPQRQQQSDAIIAWLRDARTPGGAIDLPPNTAIAVTGDLNIVGAFQPVQTLIDGDIQDETRYGEDFPPDWDDTGLADLHPLHNIDGPDDYTWRNDDDEWNPGRLDYILYTDSVLDAVQSFILNTTTMNAGDLQAAGLQRYDVTADNEGRQFDHLPLLADFRVRTGEYSE